MPDGDGGEVRIRGEIACDAGFAQQGAKEAPAALASCDDEAPSGQPDRRVDCMTV